MRALLAGLVLVPDVIGAAPGPETDQGDQQQASM